MGCVPESSARAKLEKKIKKRNLQNKTGLATVYIKAAKKKKSVVTMTKSDQLLVQSQFVTKKPVSICPVHSSYLPLQPR